MKDEKQVVDIKEQKDDHTRIPNITVWTWMRTVLKLTGTELLLFACIWTLTFDGLHKCVESMSILEQWFGITRQTISRNMNKLVESGVIIRECLKDASNPMIKHNRYYVNLDEVSMLCQNSGNEKDYQNFLESYAELLRQKFPEDSVSIDEYLKNLLSWHENKDMKVMLTLNELAKILQFNEEPPEYSISDLLKKLHDKYENVGAVQEAVKQPEPIVKEQTDVPPVVITQPIVTTSPKNELQPKQKQLFQTKKRKSKIALKNEWDAEKRNMNVNFVFVHAQNDPALLDILNKYLDTDIGRNYNTDQWQQQLDNLYRCGRTKERMLEGVTKSFMCGYKSLYIQDKSEVDMDAKLKMIDEYVENEGGGNQKLKEYLIKYINEVQRGKSASTGQFDLLLERLSMLCDTPEEKAESVKNSYANSYSSLAYPKSTTSTNNSKQQFTEPIEVEKKRQKVKEFITSGYYQLCEGLEDSLMKYVDTPVGQSMTYDDFCTSLETLRLYCIDDSEKVFKVKLAIQNNYPRLANEDFAETTKIKKKHISREAFAKDMDNNRKNNVIKYKMTHKNDPRVKDVIMPNWNSTNVL